MTAFASGNAAIYSQRCYTPGKGVFMPDTSDDLIRTIVLRHVPDVQAIYLFGSHGTDDERADSDVDLALLLPHVQAKKAGPLALTPCCRDLEDALRKDIDLVNLRHVSTVFQHQIIFNSRLIHVGDRYAVDEFEMLTMSYYQKLNDERKEILEAFRETGRAYNV
jgi:uncharacterized protein